MNKDIKDIQERLDGVGLDLFADGDCNAPLTWVGELFLKGEKPFGTKGKDVLEWLYRDFKFKHVEFTKDDANEFAYSVISVNDQLFKLEISLSSYEEISAYTNSWDWKPVKSSTKTVNIYE